ncbi:MAG: prolipoprotein diacylglyceryl transferase, partial [Planctomycetota bacterium]
SPVTLLAQIHWQGWEVLLDLGFFKLRWYSLMFVVGFWLGFGFMRRCFKAEGRKVEDLDGLLVALVLGTMIGARLGHVLFYEPARYLADPISILYIWQGGLASHGGAIGCALAIWLYCRRHPDQPFLWLLDRLVVPVAFTGALIRVGNFFNSEILGTPSDLPWAVVFSGAKGVPEALRRTPLHPAQLYESLAYLVTWLVLRWRYAGPDRDRRGYLSGLFFLLVFGARFGIEFVKLRQVEGADEWPLSMGQLLSIPVVLLGLWLVLRARRGAGTTAGA